MQLKAVVFDMGDTLILSDRWDYNKSLRRLLQSLRQNGVIISVSFDEFRRVYFEVRNHLYQKSELSLEEVDFRLRITETLREFNHNLSHESVAVVSAIEGFIDAFIEDSRMEDYVPAILAGLKERYRLGLVSNFAHAPSLRRILNHFGLTSFFDTIVISGELGLRKPHPRIFEEALKALDVRAGESVFVGDSLKADMYGAKRAGLRTVLVENVGLRKNPFAIAGELDPFPVKPDHAIPCLAKLPDVLKTLR
jgi:putative hydrolase of the HAD superfamily